MPLGKLPHPEAHVKKSRLNTQSANFRFPVGFSPPTTFPTRAFLPFASTLRLDSIRTQIGLPVEHKGG